jgi:hypothetical protein
MYEQQRSEERVTFTTMCLLDINGERYNCLVGNISTIGASIELNVSDQKNIQLGDEGSLKVLLLSQVNYECRVVRKNFNEIGLQFVVD